MLQKIQTGCIAIDRMLDGGIPNGSVSLLYGEAETGKTTLAMQFVVNCSRRGYKTIFIDCDGTFSARRLSDIAGNDFAELADLIALVRPNDFSEQTATIDGLSEYVTKNVGLVVVDTITSLYRVRIAETPKKTFELNREMNRQVALLAQIAKTHKVTLLITSQVRSIFDHTYASVEPVAQRVLKFWADTIIALKPTENPKIIRAIIEKNLNRTKIQQSPYCLLKIEKTGIQEHRIR